MTRVRTSTRRGGYSHMRGCTDMVGKSAEAQKSQCCILPSIRVNMVCCRVSDNSMCPKL